MSQIEKLSGRLEKALQGVLAPDETVHIRIHGASNEGLVCTDRQVLILKAGWTHGAAFGTNVFRVSLGDVTGVDVRFGLMSGYCEIGAAGVENIPLATNSSAVSRQNCVYLTTRQQAKAFREASNFILTKAQEAKKGATAAMETAPKDDILSMIEKLGDLRGKDLLSEDEYQSKKAELLARL